MSIESTQSSDVSIDRMMKNHQENIPKVTIGANSTDDGTKNYANVKKEPTPQSKLPNGEPYPDGWSPETHSTDKNGMPVLNKDPKRHGKYRKKRGRKAGFNTSEKKPRENKQEQSKDPSIDEPFNDGSDTANFQQFNEVEQCAEQIVGMEQILALMVFGDEWKFIDAEKQGLIQAWITTFNETGTVKMPYWLELVAAHGIIFANRAQKPSTLKFMGNLGNRIRKIFKFKFKSKQPEQNKGMFSKFRKAA